MRSIHLSIGMEKARIPRWIGSAAALGLTFGTVTFGAYMLQDEALTVVNELPTGARRLVRACLAGSKRKLRDL